MLKGLNVHGCILSSFSLYWNSVRDIEIFFQPGPGIYR